MLREMLRELWWWPLALVAVTALCLWGDPYGDPTTNVVALGLFALTGPGCVAALLYRRHRAIAASKASNRLTGS
jgi:hypothetical protein